MTRSVRCRRRAVGWAVIGVVVAAIFGAAPSRATAAVPIGLAAVTTPDLTAEEQHLLSLMDPDDRARFLLQKRLQEKAEQAALLAELQAQRHEAALSVIDNIR
jgi:hypothetical protein